MVIPISLTIIGFVRRRQSWARSSAACCSGSEGGGKGCVDSDYKEAMHEPHPFQWYLHVDFAIPAAQSVERLFYRPRPGRKIARFIVESASLGPTEASLGDNLQSDLNAILHERLAVIRAIKRVNQRCAA